MRQLSSNKNLSKLIMNILTLQITLRPEIFAEQIFAEFIFAILALNREIKFRETY